MGLVAFPSLEVVAGIVVASVVFVLGLSACSNSGMTSDGDKPTEKVAEMEETLAGVGFEPLYAKTRKNYAAVKSLPQHTLVFHEYQNKYRYVYADAELCGCVYVGDRRAYQHYQAMVRQQHQTDMQIDATALSGVVSTEWNDWGPWYVGSE